MKQIKKHAAASAPVEMLIRTVRGHTVMLDSDIASLYGVETKALNRAVKRNSLRFPDEFMFQLSDTEVKNLRCQFGTSSSGYGGRRYLPYVFTEHGVVMLSSVLNSERAIQVNLMVVRAFIRMRELVTTSKEFAVRMEKLERGHQRTGDMIEIIVEDIEKLNNEINWIKNPPVKRKHPIEFVVRRGD